MKKYIFIILFICIIGIGFFLRFYKLGEVPFGFYQDESAIGYNAYSLIHTGKDEHGVSWPLYFKSFGDYKLPIYIYATIPSIIIFGMTEFAVRFPSALFGFLTLPCIFLLTKELTKNKYLALLTMGIVAINPWSLHYNRATFEVSISLFLFVVGTWLLLLSFQKKIPGGFLLGTLCFIASLYSYNLTRLLAPLLYLSCFLFLPTKKYISKKELWITIIVSFISLIPFLMTFFQRGGVSSAGGTLIFSSAVVKAPLIEMRSYLLGTPWIIHAVLFSTPVQLLWQYLQNIAAYFSIPFFFISGSTHGNHGIGNIGQFYLFELPIMIVGFIAAVKAKQPWVRFVVSWAVCTILVASLTRDIPQATRSFFLILPYEIFSAYGMYILATFLTALRPLFRYSAYVIGGGVIAYAILFYFLSYYLRFPILYAPQWRQQDKAVSLYLEEHAKEYDHIIIDSQSGFIYSSLLFFTQYSPIEFQKTAVWLPDDSEGMSKPISFGKYIFRPIDWQKDIHLKNTLLITGSNMKPSNISTLMTFLYPSRPVVVAVKQELNQYPVQDVAYEIITTK